MTPRRPRSTKGRALPPDLRGRAAAPLSRGTEKGRRPGAAALANLSIEEETERLAAHGVEFGPPFYFAGPAGLQIGEEVPLELGPICHPRAVRVFVDRTLANLEAAAIPGGGWLYEVEPHSWEVRTRREPEWAFVSGASVTAIERREARGDTLDATRLVAASDPLLGYQSWGFCGAPSEGLLTMDDRGGYRFPMWQAGANQARCPCVSHDPPAFKCPHPNTCGLMAYESIDAARYGRDGHQIIVAAVKLWGRVIAGTPAAGGDRGWRGEFGELVGLATFPVDFDQEELAKRYGPGLAEHLGIPYVQTAAELAEQVRPQVP